MRLEDAYRSLGAGRRDSLAIIKKKYRRLMHKYHPDSAGSDNEELLRKTQEINEAYRFIQKEGLLTEQDSFDSFSDAFSMEETYSATVNERAFCERNVYLWNDLYEAYGLRGEETARGKFFWDPEQEEFSMLLRSVNEMSGVLLQEIERKHEIYSRMDLREPGLHEEFRRELFHQMVGEFVHPYECLEKLVGMEEASDGREHYRVASRVRIHGNTQIQRVAEELKKDNRIRARVTSKQIVLLNRREEEIGNLSFDEDFFYYIVIPILADPRTESEIRARKMKIDRKVRPYRADLFVDVVLRVPSDGFSEYEVSHEQEIRAILAEYERRIKRR